MESRVYFFRKGQPLDSHKARGLTLVGVDGRTGTVKGFNCFRGILVADPRLPGRQWHIGPEDFDGPVMVSVITGDSERSICLATVEHVQEAGGTVVKSACYLPRRGTGEIYDHEPFSDHPSHKPGELFKAVRIADVPAGLGRWPAKDPLWRQWQQEAKTTFRRRNPARA